ncbi:pantetheine-phosphate adenylyltransferase [Puteibacter caeruleilacunae]|nr:pantetheine-phosphate adenylyltransferase [Puteibacter caeruleilacunae]
MERIAIFPGSFDPFTIGHESIVKRALPMFDKIIIMIGYNSNKKSFFPLETRKEWIERAFDGEPKISVDIHEGLTVDFCKKVKAQYILRGLRTSADFEYERAIAQVNKLMHEGIESVFLLTKPEHTPVASTIVRDIIFHDGNADQFLPSGVTSEELKAARQ